MMTTTLLYRSARAEDNGFAPRLGFRPFGLLDAESTIAERFREVALRRGPATAVVDGDKRISYTELLHRAEAIAQNLRSRCGTAGGVVAICQTSSLATIETLLGALLGEFAYFCLDPSLPPPQKLKLLQAAAPVALEGPGLSLGELSRLSNSVETRGPSGVAALYATSGSTGEPKMVALSNRAILFDIGRQTNDLYLGPDDRFDSLFSYAFSASLATTFGPLLNGAEVHCYDPQHNITALPGWLARHRITISTMTVSMLRHLCLLGPRAPVLSAMRLLSVGGEAIHPADVEAFRSVFPASCVLQNAMASTETRTYAQYFVPPGGPVESPVPIGFPVAEKDVLLLDENGTPVPHGEGEIAIRSRYLADGYANDAQRTAIKFQPQQDGSVLYRTGDRGSFRPDGCLVFLGRTDSQAKIRGHRVELDHIAHVLELHPEVRTSVVVTCNDSGGNDQLVAYVVTHGESRLTQKPLRDYLRTQLPSYAVPSTFVFLPELPLNANFKVDRKNLPRPPLAPIDEDSSPSAEMIEVLRNIWKSVLQCSDFTDDDNFDDLGGDSLNAVRVLVAVHERFGCDLPPDTLHRFPTLALFADHVEGAVHNDTSRDIVIVFKTGGAGCPIFFAPGLNGSTFGYRHLVDHLHSGHGAYGLNIRSWFTVKPEPSVESMAANYVAEIERVVPSGGKVIVVGHSFGGTIAFEIASQLRKRGIVDPLPVIVDMPAVNAPGRPASTFRQQLLDALRNLPAWTVKELVHFHPRAFLLRSYGTLRRIVRALGRRPQTEELDPLVYFGEANLPKAYQTFLTAMYQAMHRYVPAQYEGKIVLLRAKVPTLFRSRHVTMGWERVATGGVEVHSIPGRHDDCISELHGRDLAAVLVHCAGTFASGEPSLS
jgi:acyl-coenzyme A synthetase/AMP-(fatty) acid ligase/thioesterase domain-containing protein/acyl carrier protein